MDAHERDALVAALGEVMEADAAREFFNDPVDAVALRLHDYHDIVTRPMSLSQVRDRLGAGTGGGAGTTGAGAPASTPLPTPYPSFAAAMDDIRLVWRNCRAYNASPQMTHLREKCDALHAALLAALRRRGVRDIPPCSDLPAEARRADCAIAEADVPERYNVFLGEALPYRLLDDFVVCRRDDAFATAPVETADAYDRWALENEALENEHDVFSENVSLKKEKAPAALAAYGWLAVPDPKTFEPEDDPPVSVSALTESTQAAGLAEWEREGDDFPGAPRKRKAKSGMSGRVKVWLPRVVDWSIDYENPQSLWLITPSGWYRALDPSPEYVSTFRAGAQRKFDFATRAVNALKQDPLGSYDDVLPKVLAPPPKPGRPRGRPPKERGEEPAKGGRGRGRGRGRGGRGGRGKKKQAPSELSERATEPTEAFANEADKTCAGPGDGEPNEKAENSTRKTSEKEPSSAALPPLSKPKEKPKPRDAPPEKRWGDSGRHYAESELVAEREFVLGQLEASVLAGTITTSTGKLSRHMKAFAVILEEKGDAADLDKRRRAEREQRWDAAEARGSVFSAPPPATAPRNSADARPVKTLVKADALSLAAAASARARRFQKKKGGPPPPARRDFGVEPGMVGDALAVWDMCSRHAELLRLPPFPFARLAAALCPDRKSTERITTGGAGGTGTPASAATPLASGFPSATPSLTPSLGLTTPASAVGIPTAFSDAVGAEWLAAQPGDPELASECLLRDVHCAFLRVIENADVGDHVGAPTRSTAEGGGGALPVGWPERARRLIESQPVASVKDAAFGAARSLRTMELSSIPPAQRLALLSCLAHLAADAPAFGARAKSAKDARERGADAELLGVDTTGARYWRLGGAAGIGAAFVERPGFEAGELSEPPPAAAAGFDFDSAETEATPTPTKAAAAEPAGGRTSSRRRAKPVKFEDTSVPAPAAAGAEPVPPWKSSEPGEEAKWCWYPASSFPALAAWLRASGDDGEVALAAALLEPPDALLEELEAPRADTLGGDGEDDEDATMDADLPESSSAKEKEKDKTTPTTPFALPSDPVAATAAVAAALATRKRGGGTALDGYVGLDRPLIRGVSPEGPRALVALRASLTQTLSFFPFWEGADFAKRLAAAVARARSAPTLADAAAAVSETERLFHDAGVLVVGWRSRRAAWRAAVDAARTLPQLALCAHELAEHRARDKGRVKMLREAFQRVGRGLATSGPPEQRLAAAPFLPQTREKVVLSALALRRATNALASHLESSFQEKSSGADKDTLKSGEDVSETRARALGLPRVPPDLPALTQCRVEFAGYRKGDPAAPAPAARVPHAWYLLTPLQAMAPEAAKVAGAEPMGPAEPPPMGALAEPRGSPPEAPPSADPPPPLPASPLVVAQHVFPGMAGDFLLPFEQTEAVLRRPWRAGDRVRRTFVDLRQKVRGGEDQKPERGPLGVGDASASAGKQGRRAKPVGDVVGGVVVKADWWRNAPDPSRAGPVEGAVGVTVRNARKRARVRSPWTCEPLGAVCVRWDAPPPPSAERQAGEPATAADGPECQSERGSPACGWISPWDVEPDAEEERQRARELALEAKKLERDRWLANYRRERERKDRERRERGLEPLGDEDDASPPVPKKFSAASTLGAPRAVATPPARGFAEALQAFHEHHPCGPGRPLKVPTFCHVELDLHRVFAEVQARGGFRAVTDAKRWREVCRSLGHDLSGQTSASFAMRQNYERCLLDYEAHLYEEERRGESNETRAKAKADLSSGKRKNEGASPAEAGAAKRPKRK